MLENIKEVVRALFLQHFVPNGFDYSLHRLVFRIIEINVLVFTGYALHGFLEAVRVEGERFGLAVDKLFKMGLCVELF